MFSLGKLIYEISTGRDRRVFPELPTALVEGPPGTVDEELYRIVFKTCEAEPRHRYASAAQLHADLVRLQETLTSASRLGPRAVPGSQPQRSEDKS